MKIELSKREIEAILEFMDAGKTFLITHLPIVQAIDKHIAEKKERINIDELMERLKKEIK